MGTNGDLITNIDVKAQTGTVASEPPKPDTNWAIVIGIPLIVAIAGALLAKKFNLEIGSRGDLRKSIQKQIETIIDLSAAISKNVEKHLIGKPDNGASQRDSQIQIGMSLKDLNNKIEALQEMLPEENKQALKSAFLTWKIELTNEGYPVQRKDRAFKPTDSRVKITNQCQCVFNSYLSILLKGCLNDKIKYWNN